MNKFKNITRIKHPILLVIYLTLIVATYQYYRNWSNKVGISLDRVHKYTEKEVTNTILSINLENKRTVFKKDSTVFRNGGTWMVKGADGDKFIFPDHVPIVAALDELAKVKSDRLPYKRTVIYIEFHDRTRVFYCEIFAQDQQNHIIYKSSYLLPFYLKDIAK